MPAVLTLPSDTRARYEMFRQLGQDDLAKDDSAEEPPPHGLTAAARRPPDAPTGSDPVLMGGPHVRY